MVTPQKNKYGSDREVPVKKKLYQGGNMELPAGTKNRKFADSWSDSDKSSSDHSVLYPPNCWPNRHSDEDGVQILGLQ